jgi:hypothetical protein
MPKKTAYSRSGAQRSRAKQKSFEVVRPASDKNVLETIERGEEEDIEEEDGVDVAASAGEEEEEVVEEVEEVKAKTAKNANGKASSPALAATAESVPATPGSSPKSAAARLAARRQAQKTQRSTANLIVAENYGYVRKDLLFILIMAIIMFGAIIALHFILGS